MKKLEEWEISNLEFNEYFKPLDEIDEEAFYHFLEVVPPHHHSSFVYQNGECSKDFEGIKYYDTFLQDEDRFFFLGILPSMEPELEEREDSYNYDFCPHCGQSL